MSPRSLMLLLSLLLIAGCSQYEEPLPRRDQLNYPIGLTLHPNGRYLYVVNSNFDTRYSQDLGGTLSVIDLRERKVLADKTPYLPSFGGYVQLNRDVLTVRGTEEVNPNPSRIYVTTRANNAVVVLSVEDDGRTLVCNRPLGEDFEERDDIPAGLDPRPCEVRQSPGDSEGTAVPPDPFGFAAVTITRNDQQHDLLGISHLRGDLSSALLLRRQDSANTSLSSAPLVTGSNNVTRRPGTLDFYVAGRNARGIAIFTPFISPANLAIEAIVDRGSVFLNRATERVDARDVAFSPDGQVLYAVTRRPDALHRINIGASNIETGTGFRPDAVRTLTLPDGASSIVYHTGPDGRDLLYIPCFEDRSIQVVDPSSFSVVSQIELDASPYQMITEASERVEGHCAQPGESCLGYVSLFRDTDEAEVACQDSPESCGSVAIIELDPSALRYHRVISKIQ